MSSSRDEQVRQNALDKGTADQAKQVKPAGLGQRVAILRIAGSPRHETKESQRKQSLLSPYLGRSAVKPGTVSRIAKSG